MINEINKILSDYFCKIITTDQSRSVVLKDFKKKINIDGNHTVGNLEKNLKIIFRSNIKIIGLIHKNLPNNIKLKELKKYQENIYNQTDLEKKLNALLALTINSQNYDEDWIIRSLISIYRKIQSKEEKILFNNFLSNVNNNNPNLYFKIYNNLIKKFPDIINWLDNI